MIDYINFKNFKKLQSFSLRLTAGNIVVGPNNSGKSSILDAFRLLDSCLRSSKNHNPRPMTVEDGAVHYGYEVTESSLPFSLANVTTDYSDDDAVLEFRTEKKIRCVIRLHPDRTTRFYIDAPGEVPTTSSKFRRLLGIDIVIVPTLSPLEAEENWVTDETVKKNAGNRLASRVLRNIWYRESIESFTEFKKDVETAWPDLQISKPELVRQSPPILQMFFTELRKDREVQWSGFGFQVWLQIQTHLRRGQHSSLLVIDEPDIYLHPDLQRKLLAHIRSRFGQFVMATHSTEIINDAFTNEIVSVNSRYKVGKRINTDEEYTALYKYLGTRDNADFARIAKAKKVIFVEGKDGKLLRRFARKFGFDHLADPQGPPIIQLGGFSNSSKATHAIWAFREILDLEVDGYCVFDRDYRCDEQVDEFLATWRRDGIKAHVLARKEIENFLLIPSAISKAIGARLKSRSTAALAPNVEDVSQMLLECSESLKAMVASQVAVQKIQYFKSQGSKLDDTTVIQETFLEIERSWKTFEKCLSRAPGKQLLANLNDLLQRQYSITVTEAQMVDFSSISDLDEDLLALLKSLDEFCSEHAT